jgi:tryptophan synthase alpha chain
MVPEATTTDRIGGAFAAAREQDRAALMPYMMGAYPDAEAAKAIARAYADAGADLIELGIPFSDPLADGPVIHAAATAALEAGADLDSALEACSEVSADVPVVVMAYSNMILATGELEFAERIASAGAAGAIVPDLPLGEGAGIRSALSTAGLALVPLIAPTTPEARRKEICAGAEGFVYLVSTVGVTGERAGLPPELADLVARAKEEAEVPVAVGFGISTPEQVAEVGGTADGVIVGSRLVRAVEGSSGTDGAVAAVSEFLAEAREALSRG